MRSNYLLFSVFKHYRSVNTVQLFSSRSLVKRRFTGWCWAAAVLPTRPAPLPWSFHVVSKASLPSPQWGENTSNEKKKFLVSSCFTYEGMQETEEPVLEMCIGSSTWAGCDHRWAWSNAHCSCPGRAPGGMHCRAGRQGAAWSQTRRCSQTANFVAL